MRFAVNHIAAPNLALDAFLELARNLGAVGVEIRNDLPDVVGTMRAEDVRTAADRAGVRIISVNALYPFNVWRGDTPGKAAELAHYAAACGAGALVMCPLNDGRQVSREDLVAALRAVKPVLEARGLTGLVEPLGFPTSSVRTKQEAIAAIDAADGASVFRLVHDTFHHHVAGERELYPERTGIVHVSGVVDPDIGVGDMLDPHRVLVDENDRLENLPQIRALLAGGFAGPFSFEPFAADVQALADPAAAIRRSMDFVSAQI